MSLKSYQIISNSIMSVNHEGMHLLGFFDLDFKAPPPSAALFKSVEASIFESLGDVMSSAILAVTQPLVSECQSVMSGSKRSWSLNETSLTPPKFNIAPEKLPKPNRKVVFQPPFFRGYVKLRVRIYSTSHRRKPKMVRLVKEIHSTPLNTAIKTFALF